MKISKKWAVIWVLMLTAALCFLVGCNVQTVPKAASIRTSEEFSDGTTFEYTASSIELPYGIAVDADGNDISLDVNYIILDGEGKQILESTESVFDLKVGEYTVRYEYQDVSLEVEFFVVDTVAPQIAFTATNTGDMELNGEGAVTVSLPQYSLTDYSNCSVDERLTFESDDGTYNGEYDYNSMGNTVSASVAGTFTYTVKATDASGNESTASVQWRCKDPENWTAQDAESLAGTEVLSSFGDESYLDSVLSGDMYDVFTTNGDYFAEYVDEYEGASGVVKIRTQFNSNGSLGGYTEFRFKLGQAFNLGENEGKYVVVRMYIPEDSGVGTSWLRFGGNTRSNHNYSGVIENHVQTLDFTKVTSYNGIVKGRWFNIYVPVTNLISMEAADGVEFLDPGVSDDEWFKNHQNYEYKDRNQLYGTMKYLQFAMHKSGGSSYQEFYIDSITLAERLPAPDADTFTADYDAGTISWEAVSGAEYYNIFVDGSLYTSVEEPLFKASSLGDFTSFVVVAVKGGMADSEGTVVTAVGLDIAINPDGSWSYKPQILTQGTSLNGTQLAIEVNQDFGEGGTVDMSGTTAVDQDGKPVTMKATAEGNRILLDVSDWKTSSGNSKVSVTIAAGSTFTVGQTLYTFTDEVVLTDLDFDGGAGGANDNWMIVGDTFRISSIKSYGNADWQLAFYVYGGTGYTDLLTGIGPHMQTFYYYGTDADGNTMDYSGSIRMNGVEFSELLNIADDSILDYMSMLYTNSGRLHFRFRGTAGDKLSEVCALTGTDVVTVEIQEGSTLYLNYGGKAITLTFVNGGTFVRSDLTGTQQAWTVAEGSQGTAENYLVSFVDEEGVVLGGQVVAANGKIDEDKLAAMLGDKEEYVQGYLVNGSEITLADYIVTGHIAITVRIESPYINPESAILSADGNTLTLTLNKTFDAGAELEDAAITAKDAEGQTVGVRITSLAGNTLVLDITEWARSGQTEKVSVTIEAGSYITVGGKNYTFREAVTLANVYMYDSADSPTKSWAIVAGTVTMENVEVSNHETNKSLRFYLLNESGSRVTEAGLSGVQGRYFASVRGGGSYGSNTNMDYSGSLTVNGLELYDLLTQINNTNTLYTISFSCDGGSLYYLEFIKGGWAAADLGALCEICGCETMTVRIAGGTTIYLKNSSGAVYALYFADTYTFTKDSPETSGGWSVEKTEGIGAEQVNYLVKFTDEKGTLLGSQVVAANGKIDADKLTAMLGDKAAYVTGYTVGGTGISIGEYSVEGHVTVTVQITYPSVGITDLTVSADGNTLTAAVELGKEPQSGAAVTGASFTAEYSDGTQLVIETDDISYADGSLVFDISGWRKSAETEKVSVTIKAGSSVAIGGISYLFEEDVTFVNLILYDETSNAAQCWELLGTVHTIDSVGSYASANDTLVFWIRNADGVNMSNLDVPNEKVNHWGLYHRTYASNRSLDYEGSVKINGIELSQMSGTFKDNLSFYVFELSYASAGRLMIQILSRDNSGNWVPNFPGICEGTGTDTVTFEIAAGTTIYWRDEGWVYAFRFENSCTYTKDPNQTGGWTMA